MSSIFHKKEKSSEKGRSADSRRIEKRHHQMLHVHVFFAAPLCAGNMTEPCADKHEGGISVRESPHNPRTATNLSVKAFNDVVGADARPVLIGERRVCQRFFQAILNLFRRLGQLHLTQRRNHIPCFRPGGAAFLSMDGLEHLCYQ